jgi:hypothetical protein
MHGGRSVPRASSAERVLLVPEPGKPVVASFALEIPLVIRPLGACCNSRSLKSGRKRKKRPVDARKPISTPSTADGHSMASAMACRGHGRAQACYRHRQTSHARAGGPTTLQFAGHRSHTRRTGHSVCVCVCVVVCCVCDYFVVYSGEHVSSYT